MFETHELLNARKSHTNLGYFRLSSLRKFSFHKWLKSNYRIRGGEVWTGITKFNESHFIGRPGELPFEPVSQFYPTVLQSYPVVLNQIAIGPCEKLQLHNRTKKSVQKLKNVAEKHLSWCICSKLKPFMADIKTTLKGSLIK